MPIFKKTASILSVICLTMSCNLALSQNPKSKHAINDTTFVNLKDYSGDFVYDMNMLPKTIFSMQKSTIVQNASYA